MEDCVTHDPDPGSWVAEHVESENEFQVGFTDMTAVCRRCNLVLCVRIAHSFLSTGAPNFALKTEEDPVSEEEAFDEEPCIGTLDPLDDRSVSWSEGWREGQKG